MSSSSLLATLASVAASAKADLMEIESKTNSSNAEEANNAEVPNKVFVNAKKRLAFEQSLEQEKIRDIVSYKPIRVLVGTMDGRKVLLTLNPWEMEWLVDFCIKFFGHSGSPWDVRRKFESMLEEQKVCKILGQNHFDVRLRTEDGRLIWKHWFYFEFNWCGCFLRRRYGSSSRFAFTLGRESAAPGGKSSGSSQLEKAASATATNPPPPQLQEQLQEPTSNERDKING